MTLTPRPVQRECLDAISRARASGARRALVVLATGLGKTAIAGFDIRRVMAERRGRVLYLCHNTYILGHARKTFEQVLGPAFSHGFFHGGERKEFEAVDVLYASFGAMHLWREAFFPQEFDYIVVDESHHSHAQTYRPTVTYFEPRFLLALTATPDRADLQDIRSLYGEEIFDLPLEHALARKLLAPVDYRIEADTVQQMRKLPSPVGRMSIGQLNRLLFIPRRDEEIIRIIQERMREVEQPRVLIFCTSRGHADHIARLFPGASALHSKLPIHQQMARWRAFTTGSTPVLTTVDKLNEGVDVPEANLIVFLRSTSSRTVFLQQLGRGLRKTPGKDKVLVLDFAANCERLQMLQDLWQKVRSLSRAEGAERTGQTFLIDVGRIEFSESALDVLDILRGIRRGYTKERLIAELQQVHRDLGRTPRGRDMYGLYQAGEVRGDEELYRRVFGSWPNALRAAGIEEDNPRMLRREANRRIVERFQALAIELGRTPTVYDTWRAGKEGRLPDLVTLRQHYAYHALLVRAAKLPPTAFGQRQEELIGELQRLQIELGRELTVKDLLASSTPPPEELIAYFGSTREALRAFKKRLAG